MNGVFYIIGAGPGDPELLTLKAARILGQCPVWFAPRASRDGGSTALAIVEQAVAAAGREILTHHFPMKKIRMGQEPDPEVAAAWEAAATAIIERLRQGRDVAFPTLGDPAVYSTGFYVAEALLARDPGTAIEIVPGVSSIGASAAAVGEPLCQGDDRLVVVPATYENGLLRETLTRFDAVVLMKVHRVMDRVVALLDEMGLTDRAVLVERTGHKEQRIVRDLHRAAQEPCHYFSTIIVRKSGRASARVS
ncbi:MAG: precorrin-2 C(20)-methyltransferase [Thermodesulfobacteriota bacterium]